MGTEISSIGLFEGITDPEFLQSLERLPRRKFPRAMLIFEQNEKSDEIYAILSGSVEIVRENTEYDLARVALLQPGDLFGEFSYLTGCSRTTAALAMDEVVAVEITASWLRTMEERHPQIHERLMALYKSRVLQNVLRGASLFRSLSETEIEELSSKLIPRKVPDGGEILREGNTDLDLIVIKRGKVVVTKRKGKDVIALGELSGGDVLGEMALVTGEPRSASAHASGEVEIMVLPGEEFRSVLSSHPGLLGAVEDIVKSRAAQTRLALEQVIAEIVGDDWGHDDAGQIQVTSLSIGVSYADGQKGGDAKLMAVSRSMWVMEGTDPSPHAQAGSQLQMILSASRIKDVKALTAVGPYSGKLESTEGKRLTVAVTGEGAEKERITRTVTALARARMRLFVYPEYDVSKRNMQAHYRGKNGRTESFEIVSISQTQCKLRERAGWEVGELAEVTLVHDGQSLFSTRGLCLDVGEGTLEVQFEYETGEERSKLEGLIREIARDQGYSQSATATQAARPAATTQGPILTRSFKTIGEFMKTYLASIEAGVLKIPGSNPLARGSAVRIHLAVGSRPATRLAFSGYVRSWDQGQGEVELDELSPFQKEKVEQLVRKLVEKQTEAKWKQRQLELASTGIETAVHHTVRLVRVVKVALIAILIGLSVWWANLARVKSQKVESAREATARSRLSPVTRNVVLTLQTQDGAVTVNSSDIRSLKVTESGESVAVQAGNQKFEMPVTESSKLSEFQKKQWDKLLVVKNREKERRETPEKP